MFLSFFIALLPVLVAAPGWQLKVAAELESWHSAQLAVDAAAISLGKHDALALNTLDSVTRKLDDLHVAYHSARACRLWPPCAATATSLEIAIQTLHASATLDFHRRWQAGRLLVVKSVLGREESLEKVSRALVAPIQRKGCSLCRLPLTWTVSERSLDTYLIAEHPDQVEVSVRAVRARGKWSYRIDP